MKGVSNLKPIDARKASGEGMHAGSTSLTQDDKAPSLADGSKKIPDLSDIDIFDVNDLAHDQWQFSKNKAGKVYEDFDKMDRMVIVACTQHLETLQELGVQIDTLIPLSNGRVVDIQEEKYFVHDQPKVKLPIRICPNIAGNDNLANTVGTIAQSNLQDRSRRSSIVKKATTGQQWSEMQTSWIGTQWELKNPQKGNPSLNDIKIGLQKVSEQELIQSENMKNNKYLEVAKKNRTLVWEAIFKRIKFDGDRNA